MILLGPLLVFVIFARLSYSGVDVNSEVPERSRKNFEMTFLDDFPKISRFYLREILNDFFWPVTNKFRNVQYKAVRLI